MIYTNVDTIYTNVDTIYTNVDMIYTNVDMIYTNVDMIYTNVYMIYTNVDMIYSPRTSRTWFVIEFHHPTSTHAQEIIIRVEINAPLVVTNRIRYREHHRVQFIKMFCIKFNYDKCDGCDQPHWCAI